MTIDTQYVYFKGKEGNEYLRPKNRNTDDMGVNRGTSSEYWKPPDSSVMFGSDVDYRRVLSALTPEQRAIVDRLTSTTPVYEHYL